MRNVTAIGRPVLAALALVAAAFVATLWRLWPLVNAQWTQLTTYSHGYLVAAMAVWLVYSRWKNDPPVSIRPDWSALVVLALLLLLLAVMDLLFLNVPRIYLLPLLLVAVTASVFGRHAAKHVASGAFLIYFSLPIWESAIAVLQPLTTAVATTFLSLVGVTVYISGNFVTIPSGTFEIAEDCSGLRYLLIALSLSYFYAFAWLSDWRKRVVLIGFAILAALVCNWVRVFSVILVGYLSEMQHSLVQDHKMFGWVLFLVFMIPVFALAVRLQGRASDTEKAANHGETNRHVRGVLAGAIAASVILVGARAGVTWAARMDPLGADVPHISDFGAHAVSADSAWQPRFDGASVSHGRLTGSRSDVEVYLAVYAHQSEETRLIAYGNSFVPYSWRAVNTRTIRVPIGSEMLTLSEFEGYVGGVRRLIWGWYLVAGMPASGPIEAKLKELTGIFKGRRDAVAIALSVECVADDCRAARRQLMHALESDSMSNMSYLRP
jgi:exosortase A